MKTALEKTNKNTSDLGYVVWLRCTMGLSELYSDLCVICSTAESDLQSYANVYLGIE